MSRPRVLTSRKSICFLVAFVLFPFAGSIPVYAQLLPPDTSIQRQQIPTEHFTIHYATENERLALRLARIAERTWHRFSTEYDLRPGGRVEVYLQESYDIVNSAASPLLHRSIYIFPDPPYGIPHAELGHYRDWLSLAFTHEYAHMVDLDRARGLWRLVDWLTGLGYPNLYRPLWTIEGFALWAETTLGGDGRLGSPTMEMVLRADMLERNYRTPDQWAGQIDQYPSGSLPYLYGAAFLRYINETHGSNAGSSFRNASAGSVPWEYANSLSAGTGGYPFPYLLAGFFQDQQTRARGVLSWIEDQSPVREGLLVAKPGTVVWDYLPSTDGKSLYIAHDRDQGEQRIVLFDLQTRTTKTVCNTTSFDLRLTEQHESGTVLFTDLDIDANARLVSRLQTVSPGGGNKRRFSSIGRLHDPAASPRDGSIVACARHRGRSRPVRVDGEVVTPIPTSLPEDADVFAPAWAPDGSSFVASIWSPPGRQAIYRIDPGTGDAKALIDDRHWNISPVYAPDGETVFFSSDRTGIWNIYAIDLNTQALYQITNVTTGAFLPRISSDQEQVYFVRYRPAGDEIRWLPYDRDTWTLIDRDRQPILPGHQAYLDRYERAQVHSQPDTNTAIRIGTSRPSSFPKLRDLKPIAHLPIPVADEEGLGAGLLLLGTDPLIQTGYTGWIGYGFESSRLSYAVMLQSYLSSRLRLDVGASDLSMPTGQLSSTLDEDRWRREKSSSISLAVPLLELTRGAEIRAGLKLQETEAIEPDGFADSTRPPTFFSGKTTEFSVAAMFSNARRYPLSFSPENGIGLETSWRSRDTMLGGERVGTIGEVDLRGYLNVTHDWVLAARTRGVRATRGTIEIGTGGEMTVTGLDTVLVAREAAVGVAEARVRLLEIQEKFTWDWLFLHRVHGALFGEYAWTDGDRRQLMAAPAELWSYGGRIGLDMTIGYMFRFTLNTIVVQPSIGDPRLLISFGAPF